MAWASCSPGRRPAWAWIRVGEQERLAAAARDGDVQQRGARPGPGEGGVVEQLGGAWQGGGGRPGLGRVRGRGAGGGGAGPRARARPGRGGGAGEAGGPGR